eukprot:UN03648
MLAATPNSKSHRISQLDKFSNTQTRGSGSVVDTRDASVSHMKNTVPKKKMTTAKPWIQRRRILVLQKR